jgi:dTMP kinase
MELLREHLEWKGLSVVALREPGGTELGERLRTVLLTSNDEERVDPLAELLLYEAARAQLVELVIRPSLKDGKTVLCDRFTDSTLVYQGWGRGIALKAIEELNGIAASGLRPDLTVLVDCPPETGLKRALKRIEGVEKKEDRFEKESLEFHRRVREGYLKLAEKEPDRIKVVDGRKKPLAVHKEVCNIFELFAGGGK